VSRLAALMLLAAFGPAALAATRVTVAQAEKVVCAAHSLGDAKAADKIAALELTERVSSTRLARWQSQFPGNSSREALLAMADSSAFLDLPTEEIPALVKPDPAARREILLRVVDYVNTTTHKLPNFFARRSTIHFDNVSPAQRLVNEYLRDKHQDFDEGVSPPPIPNANFTEPLRMRNTSTVLVTYRDGHEVADSEPDNGKMRQSPLSGFTTSGEFGPILSVVLGDAISGEMFWDHWEQGKDGPLAVFRYAVPQERSHYTLVMPGGKPHLPAYHGQIAVSPKDGTILRITLVSQQDPAARFQSAILVEYGPVVIGNAPYICPIRGVAISRFPESTRPAMATHDLAPVIADQMAWANPTEIKVPPQTFLNDVSFTDYHVFRAEMRVIP